MSEADEIFDQLARRLRVISVHLSEAADELGALKKALAAEPEPPAPVPAPPQPGPPAPGPWASQQHGRYPNVPPPGSYPSAPQQGGYPNAGQPWQTPGQWSAPQQPRH